MYDVFISYSSKDQTIADAVLSSLENNKIKCWIAYRNAVVGEEYAASIVRAIKDSKAVLLIYSQNSNSSKQVLNEINSATNAGKMIIPFKIDDFSPGESFEYYLGKTHWLDAITPPMQKHIDLLCQKILTVICGKNDDSTIISSVPSTEKREGYRLAKYRDLINLGYTAATIAMQLVENDYVTCNGIGAENEGTAEQWEEIIRDYNDCIIYLLDDNNKIVGDFNIIALPEHLIEDVKAGKFLEGKLSYDEVEFIGFPGEYYGYILSLSILPDHRSHKNSMLLLNAWITLLEELSDEGIFFKDWYVNIFSRETETIVKGMGFSYICDNIEFGKIYTLKFLPIPKVRFFQQHKKLVENYEKYYNETM